MIDTALYFGSYNPVHKGHTSIAEWIVEKGFAQELWFVPSPQNPFKSSNELAPETTRAEMLELAITSEWRDKISVCRVEFDLPKPSYTVNSLRKLTQDFPDRRFMLVMGADNLAGLKGWRENQYILDNFEILVYPRPNIVIDKELLSTSKITILDGAPLFDISSTELRAQFKIGKFDRAHISKDVINYIKINNLYV